MPHLILEHQRTRYRPLSVMALIEAAGPTMPARVLTAVPGAAERLDGRFSALRTHTHNSGPRLSRRSAWAKPAGLTGWKTAFAPPALSPQTAGSGVAGSARIAGTEKGERRKPPS